MKSLRTIVGLLAAFACLFVRAAEPAEFIALKRQYEAGQQRVADEYQDLLTKTATSYAAALTQLSEEFRKQGNLDAILMLKQQREHLDREGLAFCVESPTPLAVLSNVHARVQQRTSEAVQARDRAYARNASTYAAQLKTMMTALTQAGRVEDAVVVRNELDAVSKTAGVESPSTGAVSTEGSARAASLPAWISTRMPTLTSGEWVPLFEGGRLYGCADPQAVATGGHVRLDGPRLVIEDTTLTFGFEATNVALRIRFHNAGSSQLTLVLRQRDKGLSRYYATYRRPSTLNLGRMDGGMTKEWPRNKRPLYYSEVSRLEFAAYGRELTVTANGGDVTTERDDRLKSGQVAIEVSRGAVSIEEIAVRVDDAGP